MRRIVQYVDQEHPDVPEQEPVTSDEALIFVVYLNGSAFLRTDKLATASDTFRTAIAGGKYEYVDLRIERDRRKANAPWEYGEYERRHGLTHDIVGIVQG